MRSGPIFVTVFLATAALGACDTPSGIGCDAVPSRVVSTSGDTAQTVTGLRYLDLEVGTGTQVRTCTQVEVEYTGRFENGTVFDSGVLEGVIPGGRQGWIAGFEQALIGMREGGSRRAIIPPFLGYGSQGSGSIPPDATLIFDLEVRSVIE